MPTPVPVAEPTPDPGTGEPAPIPLHQVLVEELNRQYPDRRIDLGDLGQGGAEGGGGSAAERDGAPPSATEADRVRRFYRHLREKGIGRSALCLSGGGIRSATFGLGIVQGLARRGLLGKFDYLSTVSGGGYMGSWLSSWIHREPGGVTGVEARLAGAPDNPLQPEPAPVRHLRQYSRYMSPKVGLLSADTWTLAAIFARNLLLNWLVLVPLLAAVLLLPRIGVVLARGVPPAPFQAAVYWFGVVMGITAIAYIGANRPSLLAADPRPPGRWAAKLRSQGGFLWLCLLPLALMALSATLYWSWASRLTNWVESFVVFGVRVPAWAGFVLFGVFLHTGGFLVSLFFRPGWKRRRELAAVVVTGGLGGLGAFAAAWLAATRLFPGVPMALRVLVYVGCAGPLLLLLFLLAATLFVGLASRKMSDEDREWLARAGAWILIWVLGRLAVAGLVFFGPSLWHWAGVWTMTAAGGASGLVTLALGFGATSGSAKKTGEDKGRMGTAVDLALAVAAPLFAAAILIGIGALTSLLLRALAGPALSGQAAAGLEALPDAFRHGLVEVVAFAPGWAVALVGLLLLATGIGFGLCVDVNRFSLHGAYRDRLIRAYLGASVPPGERKPNPFTGFDEGDNLDLKDLERNRPFHLVNAALNLVHGKDLAVQDRKAESFTFSALHCGYRGGYRSSREYGRHGDGRLLSLGTAVAISGAAASPNMGAHSSPVVTFLLAFFNVRLGWWLGNPGPAGASSFATPGPRFSPRVLLDETFGFTDDQRPYVYLSDGGHFDNLGLYEMILRRCRFIVVSDAGADGDFTFDGLGSAMAKIRIDFGIPIDFPQGLPMRARPDLRGKPYDPTAKEGAFPYYALGRIRYSCVDCSPEAEEDEREEVDGWLLYLKLAVNGTEPADVYYYARLHPTFPHESTGNQLYSEQQFESYRILGSHVIDTLPAGPATDVEDLFGQLAGT